MGSLRHRALVLCRRWGEVRWGIGNWCSVGGGGEGEVRYGVVVLCRVVG